ncbi:MAG: nuclear transport factor 2 family protein [Streptosporangiales bacterium]|nr:nuclear transport factor 2 family protein [Streptosporangiales bacterium]
MADRAKITDLWGSYGAGNDTRDLDLLESCFAEDASFTIRIAGTDPVGPLETRKEILAFFRDTLGGQTDQRRHVLTNFRYLTDSGTEARMTAYLTLLVTDGGRTETKSAGVYEVLVVLDGNAWHFRSMALDLDCPF